MLRLVAILILTSACLPLAAQPDDCCAGDAGASQLAPPAAAGKAVELAGVIGRIQVAAGQGMPHFELKHGAEVTRVLLGPMPFLIAENFNPKSGQEVTVKGYRVEDQVVAAEVTFVAEKRTIRFRDEKGWPVWRGSFGRGARRNR